MKIKMHTQNKERQTQKRKATNKQKNLSRETTSSINNNCIKCMLSEIIFLLREKIPV